MTLTYRGSVVATAIKDFIEQEKSALGVKVVFYGDQAQFPVVPAVCVEPAMTTREVEGIPYQTYNTFTVAIMVYHTSLSGTEAIQEVCDVISEQLTDALNKESVSAQIGGGSRFGGIIISGHITRHEYGYRILADKLMRCNRLIWTGMTKTPLLEA
jgi:hypothetical protein